MDGAKTRGNVIVIGATNRPNSLDPALRRPGRLDREIVLEPPTQKNRLQQLKHTLSDFACHEDVFLEGIAQRTVGYVSADIAALARELIVRSLPVGLITRDIVEQSLAAVPASLTREYRVPFEPGLTWDFLGGMDDIKQKLIQLVEWPLRNAADFARLGLHRSRGILLHGPPGCSKTTIAKVLPLTYHPCSPLDPRLHGGV